MKTEYVKYAVSLAFIVLLGFAVYSSSFGGEFIWDDIAFVRDNELIKSWANAGKIFTVDSAKSLAPGGGAVRYNFYRPLHILSLMADYSLWKLNTFGYHLTNVIFHVLAAIALFWLVMIIFKDRLLASLTACLFVVHPVHTEAVAFISGRADPMSLAFLLFAFVFYIKCQKTGSPAFMIPAIVAYALAILSRETSAILPVLLLLYHVTSKKKIKLAPYLSIAVITLAHIIFRVSMAKHLLSADRVPSIAGAIERMPGFFVAVTKYLSILFMPFGLHMEYGNPSFTFMNPKALFGLVLTFFLLAEAIRRRKENGLIFFSVIFFYIALLPSSNIYPIGAYMAEHWLYLPSIGFFLLLAYGLKSLLKKENLRILGIIVTALLLIFYSGLTFKQNSYWNKLIPFYERTLSYNEKSPRLLNNLGVAYQHDEEYEKAIDAYRKAILTDPDYLETFANLGTAYHDVKDYDRAIAAFKKEIEINPTYPKSYNNLGAVYNDTGEYGKAIEAYRKAIELRPGQMEMLFNLGLAYQNAGKYRESIAAYKRAIELEPDYANAYNDLGVSYHKSGELEKAREAYEKALGMDPDNTVIQNNLKMVRELLLMEK